MVWPRVYVVLLMVLFASRVVALERGVALTQYLHDVWETEDGLPQNTVTTIAQTPDGYLWLGTLEGLVRFDGVRFTVFDLETTPALGHNVILELVVGRDGTLWIMSSGGNLSSYVDRAFRRWTEADGVPPASIATIFEDTHGRLWLGTDGGHLSRSDGDRFSSALAGGRLSSGVRVITEYDGAIWAGTGAGLVRLGQSGETTWFDESDGLSHTSVRELHPSRAGELWIGTDESLIRYRDESFRVFTRNDGMTDDAVNKLFEDAAGNLWVGTQHGGLNRLDDGVFTSFTERDGLSHYGVVAIFEDRERSLWIGTNAGGLNRLRDGRFTTLTTREGLSHDFGRTVLQDRSGNLWLGTEGGGVNRIGASGMTSFTTADGLANDTVLSMLEDREGALWIGTARGLSRLRDGRLGSTTAETGISSETVLALLESRDGSLWIGTRERGLVRSHNGNVTTVTSADGLGSDYVNVILEDGDGVLWIGTRGGGLSRWEEGRLTSFTTTDGLADDVVGALHEDRSGTLWVGTYGGGLTRVRDGELRVVSKRHGLFDNVIHRIVEDAHDNLWMSSNRGIFRVTRQALNAVADGAQAGLTSVAYGVGDGIRNVEANSGPNAGAVLDDGTIWFPTLEGFVHIDPDDLDGNSLPPHVMVESVRVDEQTVEPSNGIELSADAKSLEIHYTATSLLVPSKVFFRYRMEGFEDLWTDAGGRRTAYYSKLPAGRYRFQVLAANNDGVWNETGASLDFVVVPHYYETLWFRALVAALVTLVGVGFHRARVRRLQRQNVELEARVEERTAEVAAANARLARLAREDGLTGVLNRRAFDEALGDECRRASRSDEALSLVLLDVDFFKDYNDHYGHPAGDECLRTVARAVADASRRAGDLVARYGGEELAVILPGVALGDAEAFAETLRQRIVELGLPHEGSKVASVVTVSGGVAATDGGSHVTPIDLLDAADQALYRAKKTGRNRIDKSGIVGVTVETQS